MASKTDIANFALGEVGEQSIATLEDATTPAREAKRFIDQAIREVLASGKWKCARETAVLAQAATAPAFGWNYAYTLPANYVRMVTFNDVDPDFVTTEVYERRGNQILTDETTAKIVYVKDLTIEGGDVGKMGPLMVKACYLNLAVKLVWRFQQSRVNRDTLKEDYMLSLKRAKVEDGTEEIAPLPDRASSSRWVSARSSSTNG